MWKTLNENDKYEISDGGQVRRIDSQMVLKGCITNGYRSVKLSFENSKQKRFYIHHLVAEHFVTNPDPKHKTLVNHINGDKMNNKKENLEWVSPRENNLRCFQKAQKEKKERKNIRPIPVIQYDLDKNFIASYPSISAAHKATGIQVVQIARAIHGKVPQANGFIWEEGSTTMCE